MPNFGYEIIGGNAVNIESYIDGSAFTCPENGTADSITVALIAVGLYPRKLKCAIYRHSDLSLIGATQERTITISEASPGTWYTFNFIAPKPSLVAGEYYILVVWGQAWLGTAYVTSDAGGDGHYQNIAYTGTFPNPLVPFDDGWKYSIYCTYSTAAVGIASKRLLVGVGL